jgi:hypothetical protein
MTMKSALIALTVLTLTATAASAAPHKRDHRDHYRRSHVPAYEHVSIKRHAMQLAWIKRQAWADGRITFRERIKIRQAERRFAQLLKRRHRY